MSEAIDLGKYPIHLGLGAKAVTQPEFTGEMSWYAGYIERHGGDGAEGRLVTHHSFDGAWDSWEVHPNGAEVVMCTSGSLELVQEIDGGERVVRLGPGEYVVNPPGVWHTAIDSGPCSALFITAGLGTEHRPR